MQFVNCDFVVLFCAGEHLLHVCHWHRSTVDAVWWVLTLFTEGGLWAPGEVQLTGEGLSSHQVVSGVALVGDPSPSHQRNVGRRLPAVLDLGQVRTGVISGHLWETRRERREERGERLMNGCVTAVLLLVARRQYRGCFPSFTAVLRVETRAG